MSNVETGYFGVNATPGTGVTMAVGPEAAGIGTISNSGAGTGDITGAITEFTKQFRVGDLITANLETQTVLEITSDTDMTTTPFVGALSGAGFTLATTARWQILNSGLMVGPGSGYDASSTGFALEISPGRTIDNGSETVISGIARLAPSTTFSGSGASNTNGLMSQVRVARTDTTPGTVHGSGLVGEFLVGSNNDQDWPAGIPFFSPTGVRGVTGASATATGTIAHLSGITATADASGANGLDITRMFGYALIKVAAPNLDHGVGAGLYNVGGTDRTYLMLSPTTFGTVSGDWAIYDETGLDTRLSGAVKIGSGSDLVIDAGAILHQYGVALPKNNNAATAAPTFNDDATADYSVGSVWFWPDTGRNWRLRDATASAAQWVEYAIAQAPGAYVPGNWYMAPDMTVAEGVEPSADAIQFAPLLLRSRVELASLGVRIVAAEHGGNLQLALYAGDPATGRPTGNAVATTASISTGAIGPVSAAIAGGNVTLEPGLYWAGFNLDATAGGLVAVQVPSPANHPTASLIGASSQANLGASGDDELVSLHVAQSFGTWPDLSSATFVEGSTPSRNGPALQFQVA